MRLASIDVGTNTALLLVADASESGNVEPLYEEEKIVRLGQGVDENKALLPEALERLFHTLDSYVKVCRNFDVRKILLSGTSAVRDADNSRELLQALRRKSNLRMRILSGEEEARLTYVGALSNKYDLDEPILMLDIGGGSTEYILGAHNGIREALSLDVGSVRLTERVLRHDPPAPGELKQLRDTVRKALCTLPASFEDGRSCVGVAGTITTLAAMHHKMESYDHAVIDNTVLRYADVQRLFEDLQSKTLSERRTIPGLHPKRADVIVAGALILLESMRHFGIDAVRVSDRGLRYGLILDYLERQA